MNVDSVHAFLASLLTFPDLRVDALEIQDAITIHLSSTTTSAPCPQCQQVTTTIHDRFTRTLQHLPLFAYPVHLVIHGRRFRCRRRECSQPRFREDLTALVARRQRQTHAVRKRWQQFGLLAGGRSGARLAAGSTIPTSRWTILRAVLEVRLPHEEMPIAVGIDEFAWRRGHRYGTLIVDVMHHRVLDLLPDHEVETVIQWLRDHPSIQIITRDRGDRFGKAATQGAPNALQIADRFHLIVNAGAALERVLTREAAIVREAAQQCPCLLPPSSPAPHQPNQKEQRHATSRNRRLVRYEEVIRLHAQGCSHSEIARRLSLHRGTVAKYVQAGTFRGAAPRHRVSRTLGPHVPYLHQRWQEGERRVGVLIEEIRRQGYQGGTTNVYTLLRPWKHGAVPLPIVTYPAYSIAQTRWLLMKARRTEQEERYVQEVLQRSPAIATAHQLVMQFRHVLLHHDEDELVAWYPQASQSAVGEMRRFASGVHADWDAIEAACIFNWSNAQSEGQINRLKLLKRQGYGRTGFPVLQARMIGSSLLPLPCSSPTFLCSLHRSMRVWSMS